MAAASPQSQVEPVTEGSRGKEVGSQTTSEAMQKQPVKLSWASIVQNKPTLSKHVLNIQVIDGAPTVEIPEEILKDLVPLWEDFLIGKFLDTAPHVAKVHVIVNKIWTLGDKSVKIDAFPVNETTIKFRIRDSLVRDRILRRGMWNIADVPMIVTKWSPVVEEAQPEMKSIPMWVVLKNVPHRMFSWPNIASAAGYLKRLHPDTELCKSFEEAKVFVEADLTKELPDFYRFKSDQGVDALVEFKYPWLPPRCSSCKKWGHNHDTSLLKKRLVVEETGDTIVAEETAAIDNVDKQTVTTPISMTTEQTSTLETISPQKEVVEKVGDDQGQDNYISPTKYGRSSEQKRNGKNTEIAISPSRYALLADPYEDGVEGAEQ
ncbi:unnamed protein product [Microthlaspi erraticum]|uniref:DUF4283 domain-containing protein n=1 Tax=Microthlaspi erraticum TaxID=1685480 RepID=A0A6D2JA10_9BRAS|nr:unnamed protein product [Microthlaspi erraticum]